jgi:hypothetical protein
MCQYALNGLAALEFLPNTDIGALDPVELNGGVRGPVLRTKSCG